MRRYKVIYKENMTCACDCDCSCNSPEESSEFLLGGKGDFTTDSNFDPIEVEMGNKVEMEHTLDPEIADEITKDHLIDNDHYYTKLKQSGLADELNDYNDDNKVLQLPAPSYMESRKRYSPLFEFVSDSKINDLITAGPNKCKVEIESPTPGRYHISIDGKPVSEVLDEIALLDLIDVPTMSVDDEDKYFHRPLFISRDKIEELGLLQEGLFTKTNKLSQEDYEVLNSLPEITVDYLRALNEEISKSPTLQKSKQLKALQDGLNGLTKSVSTVVRLCMEYPSVFPDINGSIVKYSTYSQKLEKKYPKQDPNKKSLGHKVAAGVGKVAGKAVKGATAVANKTNQAVNTVKSKVGDVANKVSSSVKSGYEAGKA